MADVWYVRVTLPHGVVSTYNIEAGPKKTARLIEKTLLVIFQHLRVSYDIKLEKDAPGARWYA